MFEKEEENKILETLLERSCIYGVFLMFRISDNRGNLLDMRDIQQRLRTSFFVGR